MGWAMRAVVLYRMGGVGVVGRLRPGMRETSCLQPMNAMKEKNEWVEVVLVR